MNINYDYLFKILLIGDSGTGKSAMLNRYVDNNFEYDISSTIGVDFKIKYLLHNNNTIKLQVWDTAGQERFKTITSNYYRGVQGIIILFDLSNYDSFKNIEGWLKEIEKYCNSEHSKIIIGNKSDKARYYKITDEINDFIKKNGYQYIEVSAKEDSNIEEGFLLLIDTIFKELKPKKININLEKLESSKKDKIKVYFTKKMDYKNCCGL